MTTATNYSADDTALLIVDPYNDFMSKGGKHMNPSQIRANEDQDFAAGTWGGEFHPEFGPREGDVIVLEHWAQSGFANTDLDSQLKQLRIQKIILVGMIA